MLNNIFDAHAHYDDRWFDEDRRSLLSSLPQNGVSYIVNAAVDLSTAKTAIAYAEAYPFMYACAGIHPENLEGLPDDYLAQLTELLQHPRVVALGEIGLDYHWDIPKDEQNRVFEEQLRLAKELDVPVVIHDREAHGDVMALVRKYQPKGLMHCYSGSVEMLKEVIKLGMSISLGGTVTFKNARVPVEVAGAVPLDRLLLETDAPYLSPVPYRGKRNDSTKIACTAQKIAELRGMDPQELIDLTTENAKRLFGIVSE
ncbi:MAG: TatD family hydrolase [Ruminococcus sp.]|uniref:TatD family hydrolase n=1 Tax=Ruminococcus sp. TaxID=41978 RepID=UPI002873427C|nr:TatD family hydrolase [Ruminococcus sp.]MBQ3284613.1 TatD family hydrolase [Ruminococcus sp.]